MSTMRHGPPGCHFRPADVLALQRRVSSRSLERWRLNNINSITVYFMIEVFSPLNSGSCRRMCKTVGPLRRPAVMIYLTQTVHNNNCLRGKPEALVKKCTSVFVYGLIIEESLESSPLPNETDADLRLYSSTIKI